MKILVTGGTGYIGEHFIPELLNRGHNVRLLVRNAEKAKKIFGDNCEYHMGDITDRGSLDGCCDGIDIVYHMVAKVGNHLPSEKNFASFRAVNVEGTKNIIFEAKNIKKFVFVSSIAAMGIVKETPITEKSKCSPYLPYQVTKFEAEQIVLKKCLEGFPGIIVRPTKVYGAGEHEYSYLTLTKLCKTGVFPKVGKGLNYTSQIYITDFVQALIKLVDRGRFGETYILSGPDSIGLVDSGKVIGKVIDRKIIIIPISVRLMTGLAGIGERLFLLLKKRPVVTKRNIEATVTDRIYDLSKAKTDLKYEPEINMENGIKRVVKWYIEEKII